MRWGCGTECAARSGDRQDRRGVLEEEWEGGGRGGVGDEEFGG